MSYQRIPTDSENKDINQSIEMQNMASFYPQAQPQIQQAPLLQHIIVPQTHVVVTPPAPSPQELEATLRTRRVPFDGQRYISEGWTFAKHNCCSVLQILLVIILVAIVTQTLSFLLLRGIYGDDLVTWHGSNGTAEEPNSYHMRLFPYHNKGGWRSNPNGSEGPTDPTDPTDSTSGDEYDDANANKSMLGFMIMGLLQAILIYGPLTAGGFMTVFEAMRTNSRMKWRSIFSAFQCPYYKRLLPLNLMLIVFKWIGFHLFILPGLYFSIISCFAIPLHTEHRFLTGWRAIKHSYWVTRNHFCSLICFFIMLFCINFLGVLAFGFGLLISVPVSIFAFCYCYAHLVGVNGVAMMVPVQATTPQQPQPPQPQLQVHPTFQPHPISIPTTPTPTPTSPPSYIPPIAAPVAPTQYMPPAYPGYQVPVSASNPYAYQMMATPVTSAPTQPVVTHVQSATAPPTTSVPTQGPINYPTSLYPAQYPVIGRS